jgi:hypothetical protein
MSVIHTKGYYTFLLLICVSCLLSCSTAQGGATIKEQNTETQSTVANQTDRATSGTTIPGRKPLESWNIVYGVSGGFAGLRRQMELESTGKAIVTDLRQKRTVKQQATKEQMTKIANALSRIDFPEAQKTKSGRSSNCRDCFEYTIIMFSDGRPYRLHFDDESLRGSPCAGLAGLLSTMMDEALARPEP